MKTLRGKVVVVTGAGSGIGRASAHAYAQAGARVHLVDIRGDRLDEVKQELDPAGIAGSHTVDCANGDAMEELARRIYAQDGRVDLLQNGVGVLVAAPVEQLDEADWQRVIQVNLWSVIHGVRVFIPRMLRQGGSTHLVNIASVAGLVGFPFTAPYSATKFAIVGLSEALSAELHARDITVTVVCPGMVRSHLIDDGLLKLPGVWPKMFSWAYEHLAPRPEGVAKQIISAVRHRRTLVVPAPALSQLWYLKRWGGGFYNQLARELTRGLVKLGSSRVIASRLR